MPDTQTEEQQSNPVQDDQETSRQLQADRYRDLMQNRSADSYPADSNSMEADNYSDDEEGSDEAAQSLNSDYDSDASEDVDGGFQIPPDNRASKSTYAFLFGLGVIMDSIQLVDVGIFTWFLLFGFKIMLWFIFVITAFIKGTKSSIRVKIVTSIILFIIEMLPPPMSILGAIIPGYAGQVAIGYLLDYSKTMQKIFSVGALNTISKTRDTLERHKVLKYLAEAAGGKDVIKAIEKVDNNRRWRPSQTQAGKLSGVVGGRKFPVSRAGNAGSVITLQTNQFEGVGKEKQPSWVQRLTQKQTFKNPFTKETRQKEKELRHERKNDARKQYVQDKMKKAA